MEGAHTETQPPPWHWAEHFHGCCCSPSGTICSAWPDRKYDSWSLLQVEIYSWLTKEQGLIGLYCIYANTLLDKFHNSSSKKQSEEWVALDTQDGHSLQPNHHRHEPLEDDVWGENRVKQNWTLGKGQSGLSLIWTGCRQRHMHPIHWKIEFNAMIKWRRGTVLITGR